MPNADVSHARPLQAVVPELARGEMAEEDEDYSEFLICMERQPKQISVSVWKQRNAALVRQAVGKKKFDGGELWGFVASTGGSR